METSRNRNASMQESYLANSSKVVTFRNHIEQLESVPENTLDEPVWMTFFSELKHICQKFRHVLVPNADSSHRRVLRKLDLWGPFLMCMILGLLLNSNGCVTQIPISSWCCCSLSSSERPS